MQASAPSAATTTASTPGAVHEPAPAAFVALGCALLAGALVAAAFAPTVGSIVHLWSTSDTFAHGWFVLPLCAWLTWRRRSGLRAARARGPDWRMLAPLAAGGALWLVGRTAHVLAVEQLGFTALLIAVLAFVLGREPSRALRFPLLFLAFLAPVGAEIVPALMELTADTTVWAIRMTGIPVYREGLYFTIPSGQWSVVEACSGIRYLIASMMLGTLYAGLCLHGAFARAAFLALSVAVPLAANGVRAFGIVMLGHHSDMRLATGADHLLYGWLFFGVVMFGLFAIGARLPQAPPADRPDGGERRLASPDGAPGAGRRAVRGALVGVLAALAFPGWASVMDDAAREAARREPGAYLPAGITPLAPGDAALLQSGWAPIFVGADSVQAGALRSGSGALVARAFVYAEQRQGKELIGYANRLVARDEARWRTIGTAHLEVRDGTGEVALRVASATLGDGAGTRLLAWRWNAVRGHHTDDAVRGKLHELAARLTLDPRPSIGYVLSIDADAPDAEARLRAAALRIAALAQLDAQAQTDARAVHRLALVVDGAARVERQRGAATEGARDP